MSDPDKNQSEAFENLLDELMADGAEHHAPSDTAGGPVAGHDSFDEDSSYFPAEVQFGEPISDTNDGMTETEPPEFSSDVFSDSFGSGTADAEDADPAAAGTSGESVPPDTGGVSLEKDQTPKTKTKKDKNKKEKPRERKPMDFPSGVCLLFFFLLFAVIAVFNVAACLTRTPNSSVWHTICFISAFDIIGFAAAAIPLIFWLDKFKGQRTLPNVLLGIAAAAMLCGIEMMLYEFYRYDFIVKP